MGLPLIGTSLAMLLTYLMHSGWYGKSSAIGGWLFGAKAAVNDVKLKASVARKEISSDNMLMFC